MSQNKLKILQDTFGFDEFRPLQEPVVDKILNREDVLLILPTGQDYEVDEVIFAQLRALRMEIAKEESMPAYIIFDNKTLTEMARFLPDNEANLLQINGVGQIKIEKYGTRFLALLATLRTDDFQTPMEDSVQEAEVKISPAKKLHATYQATLALIEQESSTAEMCQQRELTLSTILGHINNYQFSNNSAK
jgi:ATP-dependent DNA helicase RecQ